MNKFEILCSKVKVCAFVMKSKLLSAMHILGLLVADVLSFVVCTKYQSIPLFYSTLIFLSTCYMFVVAFSHPPNLSRRMWK